jgi:hypothetical protein
VDLVAFALSFAKVIFLESFGAKKKQQERTN